MNRRIPFLRTMLVLLVGAASVSERLFWTGKPSRADDAPAAKDADAGESPAATPARFLTIPGIVDERMGSRIENAALELQNEAVRAGREAVFVLEIHGGPSRFGLVSETAGFLASSKVARVRTVAWIPKSLDGNNVILALACRDIVMHPDATIGDVGRGSALDKVEQQSVLALVRSRVNPRVSPALAAAMMDPQSVALKASVENRGNAEAEIQVVTREELEEKRNNNVVIRDVQPLKEPGVPGKFSGRMARELGFLVAHTAETRADVADLYRLSREAMKESELVGDVSRARMIRIERIIDTVMETFIERQIDRAIAGGASVILFEIDSPGGELQSCERLAQKIASIDSERVRTAAWIPHSATGGAALAALACDDIYMTDAALLGDIVQAREDGEDGAIREPDRVVALVSPVLEEIARKRERSAALMLAMVDKDLRVLEATNRETGRKAFRSEDEIHATGNEWIPGPAVPETQGASPLVVSGRRAHELGLAERPLRDFDDLKKRLGIPAAIPVNVIERTWLDDFVFRLNSPGWMFTLIVVGIVCLYLDLHLMTGILGIVSALCFALFFWSKFLGGTAGWLEVTLFVLGVSCMAMEIFVIPGFGVFGVSGGLMILASLIMASQTFGNIESGADVQAMSRTVGTLSAAILSVVVIALVMGRYLPQMPFLNSMFLTPPGHESPNEPRLSPWLESESPGGGARAPGMAAGTQGLALSMLRPAGKADIAGRYVDVVSEGAFIEPGTAIEVTRVEGNRIVVRAAKG